MVSSPLAQKVKNLRGIDVVPNSDFAIIHEVLNGDKDSYRHLVVKYKNMVYSMIIKQVRSPATAEDLSQEAFVKAYLNLRKFRFESAFSTWLIRIALNVTNTYFSTCREMQFQDPPTHAPSSESDYQKREFLKRMQFGISKLKPKFRDVLVLCGLEGKSYEEVAQILDIPIGTVRSRLNTARVEMKSYLKDLEIL